MVELDKLDWEKVSGLMPAVIQDSATGEVLMLGYMNREALDQTLKSREVTFYSRTKQRLWRKGETSGQVLRLQHIATDCDGDSLLVQATPSGPVCHLGYASCFQPTQVSDWQIIVDLTERIKQRDAERPEKSYTTSLFIEGKARIAQKVGEEAVEVVIAAVSNETDTLLTEAADLIFHFLVLLHCHQLTITDVLVILQQRMATTITR